jgi:hypothetical protein
MPGRPAPLLANATFVSLVALGACACSRGSSAPVDAGPARTFAPPPIAATNPPAHVAEAGAPRHRLNLTCRALAVKGSATITLDGGTRALATSDPADGRITTGPADTVTVRLPKNGRELTFSGEGTFEPCAGDDEAWLYRGRFDGERGSGEAPGAEQWIVTPFGVVRYGAAILDVAVDDTSLRASLKAGSATILPEGSTAWQALETEGARVVKGAVRGKAGTASADERCTKASAASKALQDELSLPDASASPIFGDLAMRANDANVLARALCAVAKVRATDVRK